MAKDIGEDQLIFDQVLEANGCGIKMKVFASVFLF